MTLKVYILSGQSNMVGQAHIYTLPYAGMDPITVPLLKKIQDESGTPRTFENIWISAWTRPHPKQVREGNLTLGYGANPGKVGPELTFGITMDEIHNHETPILLIKAAWGGKTLHTDFRPPSAGKETEESGVYYDMMMKHIRRVLGDIPSVVAGYTDEQGYEIGGFVWFQGWNDIVDKDRYPNRDEPGGYDEYGQLLTSFIQDVRKDLEMPDLPFLIGVVGHNGPDAKAHIQHFRKAQEMPVEPGKLEHVTAVRTEIFWDAKIAAIESRIYRFTNKIKQHRKKHPEMTDEEADKQLLEWRLEHATQEEIDLYDLARSDGAYHYFGCAKFHLQAGRLFAEELYNLEQSKKKDTGKSEL